MKAERSEEQRPEAMEHRPGARGKRREVRLVRTSKAFCFCDAARQLVPADRGSNRLLQIGAAFSGLDQRRSQLGQKTHLVVDRPRIANQGLVLADFGTTEHAAHGAVEQGDGVVGQPCHRIEHGSDQGRPAAQRRQSP